MSSLVDSEPLVVYEISVLCVVWDGAVWCVAGDEAVSETVGSKAGMVTRVCGTCPAFTFTRVSPFTEGEAGVLPLSPSPLSPSPLPPSRLSPSPPPPSRLPPTSGSTCSGGTCVLILLSTSGSTCCRDRGETATYPHVFTVSNFAASPPPPPERDTPPSNGGGGASNARGSWLVTCTATWQRSSATETPAATETSAATATSAARRVWRSAWKSLKKGKNWRAEVSTCGFGFSL